MAKSDLNQKELYDRYKYQQNAEREFNRLQAEVKHIQSLIVTNPNLQMYYNSWLKKAKHALKEYSEIIESPDSISFSVIFLHMFCFLLTQELIQIKSNLPNIQECFRLFERSRARHCLSTSTF